MCSLLCSVGESDKCSTPAPERGNPWEPALCNIRCSGGGQEVFWQQDEAVPAALGTSERARPRGQQEGAGAACQPCQGRVGSGESSVDGHQSPRPGEQDLLSRGSGSAWEGRGGLLGVGGRRGARGGRGVGGVSSASCARGQRCLRGWREPPATECHPRHPTQPEASGDTDSPPSTALGQGEAALPPAMGKLEQIPGLWGSPSIAAHLGPPSPKPGLGS